MKGQSRKQNISKVQKDSVFSRRTAVAVVAGLLICAFFTGMNLLHSQAQEKTSPYHKYYTSIRIQKGDSLWSIAESYKTHSGKSTAEYVHDLRQMNSLSDDTIHAGNYLTVYYYDLELK